MKNKGTLLQIAQMGEPVLRQKAKVVNDISSPNIQMLIDSLLATVMDASGVGIAAPQVYQSLRVIIVASHPNSRYPKAPIMKPTPMINPAIVWHNDTQKKDWEGCLSIPGIRAPISRFTRLTLSYFDRYGKQHTKKYSDFIAKIIQHEIDHLDGILFVDRVESNRELISEKAYQTLMQSQNKKI